MLDDAIEKFRELTLWTPNTIHNAQRQQQHQLGWPVALE
jgi:hypothetical protein